MESYITRRPPDERLMDLSETIQSQLGFRCEIEYFLDHDGLIHVVQARDLGRGEDHCAIDTKVFYIYEVINGKEYHNSVEPRNLPVEDYLKQQGRFSHLGKEDFEYIQQKVDYEWKVLLQRSMMESFQIVM